MRYLAIAAVALQQLRECAATEASESESFGVLFARGVPVRREGRVAVLSLNGLLDQKPSMMLSWYGGTSTEAFGRSFDEVIADESVRAVVLDVDSPGGYVTGTPELAAKIHAARGSKPIIAVANPMAASAALYIASAADEFYVSPSGDVGSLGVRSGHLDFSGRLEQLGIVETTVVAKDSPYKAEFSDAAPLSDDAHAEIQRTVDAHMEDFVSAMAKHRGVSTDHVKEHFGKGRMMMPKQAKAAGLVDGIGTFDAVLAKAVKAAGRRSTRAARARLDLRRSHLTHSNTSR